MTLVEKLAARVVEINRNKLTGIRTNEAGEIICYYCREPLTEFKTHRDHVVPKSKGGSDEPFNRVVACAECNLGKGTKHPLFFFREDATDEETLDYIARILFSSAIAHKSITVHEPPRGQASKLDDIAEKLAVLSEQLTQITKWLHMIEQEVRSLTDEEL